MYLYDFGSAGSDGLEAFLGDLARDRAEDAAGERLLLALLEDDDCVLVEPDVRSVLAAEGVDGANDDGMENVLFLDGLTRFGFLDRKDDELAKSCDAFLRSAEHFEDASDFTAGIVCYLYD